MGTRDKKIADRAIFTAFLKATEFESHPNFRRFNQNSFLQPDTCIHRTNMRQKMFERIFDRWIKLVISIHLVQLMNRLFHLLVRSLSTLFESIERFSFSAMTSSWRCMGFPYDGYCDRARGRWFKKVVEAVRMPYHKKMSENQLDNSVCKGLTPRSLSSLKPQFFKAAAALA